MLHATNYSYNEPSEHLSPHISSELQTEWGNKEWEERRKRKQIAKSLPEFTSTYFNF